VGLPFFLGVTRSRNEVIVQAEGTARRIAAKHALKEFARGEGFRDAVLLFAHDLFVQVSHVTSCNRHHEVEQRLSRWLLMMHDRSDGDTLQISQNLLAQMLGVQRPSVTNAIRELERARLIAPGRQQVTILDRQGLMKASCECYQLVRTRTAFHLPKTYA